MEIMLKEKYSDEDKLVPIKDKSQIMKDRNIERLYYNTVGLRITKADEYKRAKGEEAEKRWVKLLRILWETGN